MLATKPQSDGGLTELSFSEMEEHRGGAVPAQLQFAMFFVAAFKAGFAYGYGELGPALFGE
jgi:hypothetical protein